MGKLRFKRQDVSLNSLMSKETLKKVGHKLTCMFGMDYRSMALFRFCMAACVIGDIVERSMDLFVLYTENGLMPRQLIVTKYSSNYFLPLHLINTSFTFQAILFTVHAIIAFLMAIGYRTKLTSILTWFLTISLQAYNGIVGHGGDVFFRMMLFFTIFIPTAQCFAVDSWHFEEKGEKNEPIYKESSTNNPNNANTTETSGHDQVGIDMGVVGNNSPILGDSPRPRHRDTDSYRFLGFGTLAILIQMSCMYVASFFHKSGEEWHNGEATFYAITLDYFATDFAKFVVQWRTTLKLLTIAVAKWELLGSFFLYSPIFTDYCRLFGAIGFMAMHLGFVLCLKLGLFFWVTFTAQTCNLPPMFWEIVLGWCEKKIMKGQGPVRVFYNTSSPLSQYITLTMKTFFIIPTCATYQPLDQLNATNKDGENVNDIVTPSNVDNSDDEKQPLTDSAATTRTTRRSLLGDDWFVTIDSNGVRRRNLMALNYLCSKSPLLFGLSWLAGYTPAAVCNVVSRAMLFAHTKSQESQTLSKRPSVYQLRKHQRRSPHKVYSILNNIWMCWVCYVILAYNLNTFRINIGWKHEYTQMAFLFRWDQGWNMFSPSPPKTHWWHTIHGKLDDDTPVELFKNETFHNLHKMNLQVDYEKPVPFDRSYGNHRWFKFWENGYNAYGGDSLRLETGRYICRQFNTHHHGSKMLYSFTVYFVHEFQNLDGTVTPLQYQSLWNHICYDKPTQQAKT